jgi:acetyl esterase
VWSMIQAIVCAMFLTMAIVWLLFRANSGLVKGRNVSVTFVGRTRIYAMRLIAPLLMSHCRSKKTQNDDVKVESLTVNTTYGPCSVVIYRPASQRRRHLPVHFNFHGGGFIVGFPRQDEIICRRIALEVHCAVVNVDYCLAPEQPFPAPILQSYEVVKALLANANLHGMDPEKITLGGHSAGGNIAASLALLARDRKELNIKLQILVFACFDFGRRAKFFKYPTPRGPALSAGMLDLFTNVYLPKLSDRHNPLASPLRAKTLKGLPRSIILVGDKDLLQYQSAEYSSRLKKDGTSVLHLEFPGCDHGFTHTEDSRHATDAVFIMIRELRDVYRSASHKG